MADRQAEPWALIGATGDQGTRRPPGSSPATTSRQEIRCRGVRRAGAWNSALTVLRAHRPPPPGHATACWLVENNELVVLSSALKPCWNSVLCRGKIPGSCVLTLWPEVAASPRSLLPALWQHRSPLGDVATAG